MSVDPFHQYTEDKFSNSLKGYLKDIGAVLELYKASQIIIHPDESVLVRQNAWTRHILKEELSCYQSYVDKPCSYVEHEVVCYINLLHDLVIYVSAILLYLLKIAIF